MGPGRAHVPSQVLGALAILVAFCGILAAACWGAWWTFTRAASNPLAPGEAALYRVTYGPGQRGLYAIHVRHPGPFPLEPSRDIPPVQLEQVQIGQPGLEGAARQTGFYRWEPDGLRLVGSVENWGGGYYTPEVPSWLSKLAPEGPAYAGQSTWQVYIGPWALSWNVSYTMTRHNDERLTVPAGTFTQAHPVEWQQAGGPLFVHQRIWFVDEGGPLPVARVYSERTSQTNWTYELLSATWLPTGMADPAGEAGADGPVYLDRGNAARQGFIPNAPTPLLRPSPFPLYWHWTVPDDITSPPLLASDLLLFGDVKGVIWAVDAQDGNLRWIFTTGRPIVATPAVAGGIVYVPAGSRLYALSANEGLYLWSASAGDIINASPLIYDGLVLFGAEDGWFYALDARRGILRWRFAAGARVVAAAAAEGNAVCFGTTDGGFYALDVATGNLRWQADLEEALSTNPVIHRGTVYVGTARGQVTAFSLETGKVLWKAAVPGGITVAPAADETSVYVTTGIGAMAALDQRSGARHWMVYGGGVANAPLVVGDAVILPDTAGVVHILATGTGTEVATLRGFGPIGAPVAYSAAGLLVLVDRYRHVYALSTGHQAPGPSLRVSPLWDRSVVSVERTGSVVGGPVAWREQLLLLLSNGDLWIFHPESGNGTLAAQLGGGASFAPVVLGDMAYIALAIPDGKGAIVAFDLTTRRVRWQASLDSRIDSLEASDGRVFVTVGAPQSASLVALDADQGRVVWEEREIGRAGALVAVGNQVYMASGHVSAWDAVAGEVRWRSPDIGAAGSPAVCGELLYVNAWYQNRPVVAALSQETGEVRWWGEDGVAFPLGQPACDPQGNLIFVGGFDGQIHAYDTKSGQVRWVRRVGEPFSSSLVIADGVIYGLTIRMTVVGLDPETGRLLARYTPFATSSESSQGRLLHLGGRMFMASSSFLYAMEISHE